MKPNSKTRVFIGRLIWCLIFIYLTYLWCTDHLPVQFYGDSGGYWALSQAFVDENGAFAFTNARTGPRGYFISYLIYLFIEAATFFSPSLQAEFAYYIGFSVMLCSAVFFTVPYFFNKLFKVKSTIWSSIIFYLIFWFFWGGDFCYPLTDIPSICFISYALAAFMKLRDGRLNLIASIALGLCAAATYNMRQVYMIFMGVILIAAVIRIVSAKEKQCSADNISGSASVFRQKLCNFLEKHRFFISALRKALKIGLVSAGVILVMLPQVLINAEFGYSDSWQVPTELYTAGEKEDYPLLVFNANGLNHFKKVDFYVTNPHGFNGDIHATNFPNTPIELEDDEITDYAAPSYVYTYEDYFKVVFNHLDWFIPSWFYSAFLGMSVTYNTAYVTDLTELYFERLIINYFILAAFLTVSVKGLFSFIRNRGKSMKLKENGLNAAVITGLILSGLVSCLTKMESRYLMPWYFIAYGVVVFYLLGGFRFSSEFFRSIGKKAVKYSGILILIVVAFLAVFLGELKDHSHIWTALLRDWNIIV